MLIPIEISAKHIHLSQKDLDKLFGRGYVLKKLRDLNQPGQFAAKETLKVKTSKGEMKVRVVAPIRKETQIEMSLTDAIRLGLNPPIRISAKLKNTPGILLIGPKERTRINQGVIISWRHIHCNPQEAKKLGLKNKDLVSVKIKGNRSLTFHNVKVRVHKDFKLSMHIDTDEGNATGIIKKTKGTIV